MNAARPLLLALPLLLGGTGAPHQLAVGRASPNDSRVPAGVLREYAEQCCKSHSLGNRLLLVRTAGRVGLNRMPQLLRLTTTSEAGLPSQKDIQEGANASAAR